MKKIINLTMFDLLKGVAMLGVLFIHSIYLENRLFGSVWYERIGHTLLMPSFFLMSGYWLKKKSIKEGVKNGTVYLLKPLLLVLVIMNFVGFVHRAIQGNLQEWVDVFLVPSVLMTNTSNSRLGPLWYILALFWAWCIFYVVVQVKDEKRQILIAVLSALIGGILMPFKIPFQIAQGLVAFFYVYVGYLIKKKKLLDKKLHFGVYIFLAAIWLLIVNVGSLDFYFYNVKYGIISVIGSLCGAFLLIKLFLYINLLEWKALDGIRWVGRYSMWFMCIHALEGAIFPWKFLFAYVEKGRWTGTLLQFVLRVLLILSVCIMLQKFQMYYKRRKLKSE